jgi:hypothetical protein
LLIYFRSVNKHDRHRQFLFLNGWLLQRKDFYKSTNQKIEFPVVAMFVNGSELN